MKKITTLGIILVLFFNTQNSKAQNISTFAGDGTAGYSGDGSSATSAEISGPYGLCFNLSGDLLIPDKTNNCIRMVNTSGTISTIAGNFVLGGGYSGDGGAATSAQLDWPEGVAVNPINGNIYIADHFNNRIRMVNTSGIISTIAGNGIAAYSGDGSAATSAEIYSPIGIVTDAAGNIYFTDAANFVVRKINTSGIISTVAGNNALGAGYSGDGGAATSAQINWCGGVAIDAAGNLYISDTYNGCIRKVNTSGIISTIAGNYVLGSGYSGDGGAATSAQMNWPSGLTVSGSNLLISEEKNNCVRKVNLTTGIISTIAGNDTVPGFSGDGGPATAAELNTPVDVNVNSTGDIFISDYNNNRIRKIISNTQGINTIDDGENSISVYPNPAKDAAYIQMQNTEKVILYSITGQKILESNTEGKQSLEISTSGLPDGVYLITVLMADGSSIVKKLDVAK